MIISHKNKYLFIEVPHTATTAIRKELRENYDGASILRKHMNYGDFQKVATAEEKTYFVFAGVRNPLDEAVSVYFKYKTNHKGLYSNPKRVKLAQRGIGNTNAAIKQFNFLQTTNANFSLAFKKFYRFPYNSQISLSEKHLDFVIRFEHLQEDFSQVLRMIGIQQKRPLPVINKTGAKQDDFLSYYTPDIIPQAKRVFGPFMKKWGYDFPPEWGDYNYPLIHRIEFLAVDAIRQIYWRYFKNNRGLCGRIARWVRGNFAVG